MPCAGAGARRQSGLRNRGRRRNRRPGPPEFALSFRAHWRARNEYPNSGASRRGTMNVARMRLLDRWLGAPVCLLLTLLRRLCRWQAPGRIATPRRILFVKLAEQGSTVLAQEAFQAAIA